MSVIKSTIVKKDTIMRPSLPPEAKLMATVQLLATGCFFTRSRNLIQAMYDTSKENYLKVS